MEINITHLMLDDMSNYSASIAETGLDDIGAVTWQNALDMFDNDNLDRYPDLVSGDDIQTVKDYFATFGAWSREEIDDWDTQTVNALLLQMIAGDIREREYYAQRDEIDEYDENIGGRLYQCDLDQWYYLIGI